MSDLQPRIDVLVAQLLKLSEARSQKLGRTDHRKPESSPPAGTRLDRSGNPDPDDSLYHYFIWKFYNAKSDQGRLAAVAECEIRLKKRLNSREARAVAGAVYGQAADVKENERRVAEDYVGLHPAEVSAIEGQVYGYCPTAHVRSVRLQRKRQPDTGEPFEEEQSQLTYALELRAAKHSIRSIAIRMGKPKSTIADWFRRYDAEREEGNGKAA